MATVTITAINKCFGGAHWGFTGTVNDVPGKKLVIIPSEIAEEWENKPIRERFEARLWQECLEKGITTYAAMRTNFLNRTIQI